MRTVQKEVERLPKLDRAPKKKDILEQKKVGDKSRGQLYRRGEKEADHFVLADIRTGKGEHQVDAHDGGPVMISRLRAYWMKL